MDIPAEVTVTEDDVELLPIRAQGPGGQNVNKVSSAVQLRFDIRGSRLPEAIKERMLALSDQRINKDGVLIIKAQTARSLEQNKAEAMARLAELVERASTVPKARRPTRPTHASRQRRLQSKTLRADVKAQRAKVRT